MIVRSCKQLSSDTIQTINFNPLFRKWLCGMRNIVPKVLFFFVFLASLSPPPTPHSKKIRLPSGYTFRKYYFSWGNKFPYLHRHHHQAIMVYMNHIIFRLFLWNFPVFEWKLIFRAGIIFYPHYYEFVTSQNIKTFMFAHACKK